MKITIPLLFLIFLTIKNVSTEFLDIFQTFDKVQGLLVKLKKLFVR